MNGSQNETGTNTSSRAEEGELSDWAYGSLGTYFTLVGITALIGNGLMLFVFLKHRMFSQTINILILNVIVSDILQAVLVIPFAAISTFYKKWVFGDWGCSLYGFVCYVSVLSAMCTYVAISTYRYAVMCRPSFAIYLRQKKKVRMTIACIWIYACFWSAMPFLSWGRYTREPFGTSCSIDWHGHSAGAISYVICLVLFILFVPLSIMVYWYVKILVTTKVRVSHGVTQNNAQITDSRHGVSYVPDIEKRATKIVLVTVAVYLTAWLPYGFIFLISAAGAEIPLGLSVVPTVIATAQCAYNPIIYAIGHTKFKVRLMETLSATAPVVPVAPPKRSVPQQEEISPMQVHIRNLDNQSISSSSRVYVVSGGKSIE